MIPLTHTNPESVNSKIAALGLDKAKLMDVVHVMVAARNGRTANDVPSAPGYYAWSEGTRRMRELFIPDGWVKDESGQLSTLYSEERGLKIVVSNTDEGTGLLTTHPQNRSQKGAATDRAISSNQLHMEGIITQLPQGDSSKYWYLCVYSEGDIFRAELSWPVALANGYFTGFKERIILIGDDDKGRIVTPATGNSPIDENAVEFDVSVTKKAQ